MNYVRVAYLLAFGLMLAVSLPQIVNHYLWLMGGEGLPLILRSRWDIVAVNVVFFLLFLVLIPFRAQTSWRSKGVYSAFIIALFAEMYGFPLTAYFMANYVGAVPVKYHPGVTLSFNFMGVRLTMTYVMILGGVITTIGLLLVILGWIKVHKSGGSMVTSGVYRYSRHPQYLGILLVTFGWLIHWPTILTLIMWPILAVSYYRLARKEEAYMLEKSPKDFREYVKKTPMFL